MRGLVKNLVKLSLFIGLLVSCLPSYAQSPAVVGPRRQIATIIFAGLGGAVIGLSTLSFYGQPQEHASNIATGFGLGIIGGVAYVSYKTTTQNQINHLGGNDLYAEYRSGLDKKRGPIQVPMFWQYQGEF